MTRNVVIIAINLLIAAVIGGNAGVALLRGCDFGGRCSGTSDPLTWALGIGLPLLVLASALWLGRLWLRDRHSRSTDDRITITIPLRRKAAEESDPAETLADDVMSERLARTTSAAHIAEAARLAEEAAAQQQDFAPDDSMVDDGLDPVAPASGDAVGWSLDKQADEPAASQMSIEPPSIDAVAMPLPFHPSAFAAAAPDDDDEGMDEGPIDWLIDPDSFEDSPQVRPASGFPWVVAGIDHVCIGMARLGTALAGSDFPSEASAWRQVVTGLPRHHALATDDAAAFTDWLNSVLDTTGPDGLILVEDALHELAVEAATDPALCAALPSEIAGPVDQDRMRGAMRLSK